MEDSTRLVFFGEVLDGFAVDEVKEKLGELLKLDEVRLARLFSGNRSVLKQSLGAEEAQRHVERFARVGARLRVEAMAAPDLSLAPVERPTVAVVAEGAAVVRREPERDVSARPAAPALESEPAVEDPPELPPAPAMWGIGWSGRMGRMSYATALLTLVSLRTLGDLIQFWLNWSALEWPLRLIGYFMLYQLFRLTALRLHDMGRSAWVVLLAFLPVGVPWALLRLGLWRVMLLWRALESLLAFVAGLVLVFWKGTDGDNKRGELPPEGGLGAFLLALAATGVTQLATKGSTLYLLWAWSHWGR